MDKGT